ncbi:MAG: hypothetical protein ACP5IE_07405 [Infirmifilum sp.]
MLRSGELRDLGHGNVTSWMERCEELWKQYRGKKQEKDIYEWLDYYEKLSSQDPTAKYRVVYNASGKHLAASVINVGP